MGEDANREDLLVPQMPHDPPGMGHAESRHGVLPAPPPGGRRGLPLHAAQDGDFLQGFSTFPVIITREEDCVEEKLFLDVILIRFLCQICNRRLSNSTLFFSFQSIFSLSRMNGHVIFSLQNKWLCQIERFLSFRTMLTMTLSGARSRSSTPSWILGAWSSVATSMTSWREPP